MALADKNRWCNPCLIDSQNVDSCPWRIGRCGNCILISIPLSLIGTGKRLLDCKNKKMKRKSFFVWFNFMFVLIVISFIYSVDQVSLRLRAIPIKSG